MNDIFINVYLDEDVNILVAKFVRRRNFKALTVTEATRKGKSDAEQLEYATQNGYAILTHNRRDFEKLAQNYFANGEIHGGIIIAVRRPSHQVAERLINILNDFMADEMKNQIIYI